MIIFTAIGFVMFYIFSLFTHKSDPVYPGKKIIQGLIVFSMTWIFFLIFLPISDILRKYKLQDSFFGYDLGLEYFYYEAVKITIVLCYLNMIGKEYYQRADNNITQRLFAAAKKPTIYASIYIGAAVLTYLISASFVYSRKLKVISPKVFIMSYQMQSYIPPPSDMKVQLYLPISYEAAFMAPFIFLCMIYFCVYGASSLSIFPLESIKNLITAPSKPEPDFQVYAKQNLIKNGQKLIEEGKRIYSIQRELDLGIIQNQREKNKRQKKLQNDMILYKKRLYQYEEICEYFKEQENLALINPIQQKLKLGAMIFASIVSLSILIQNFLLITDQDFLLDNFMATIEKKQPILPHIIFIMVCVYLSIAICYSLKIISIYLPFKGEYFGFEFKKTYDDTVLETLPILIMSVFGFQLFMPKACDTYYAFTEISLLTLQIFQKVRYYKRIYDNKLFIYGFILVFVISMFISFFIQPARRRLEEMNEVLQQAEEEKQKLKNVSQQIQLIIINIFYYFIISYIVLMQNCLSFHSYYFYFLQKKNLQVFLKVLYLKNNHFFIFNFFLIFYQQFNFFMDIFNTQNQDQLNYFLIILNFLLNKILMNNIKQLQVFYRPFQILYFNFNVLEFLSQQVS